jgi:putative ABC transport system ATP-binding protein
MMLMTQDLSTRRVKPPTGPDTTPCVQLRRATRVYDLDGAEVNALGGIDLEIPREDYVAVMGPSGSGKSTLLNLIGCLDRPTSGSVLIEGSDTARLPERQLARLRSRFLGFVFQSFELLPRATALANVELPLLYQEVPPAERKLRAERALAMVGLESRADHWPNQLSGGERQRVAIARAVVGEPRVLLADEPTGNLDSKSGSEVLGLLDRLSTQGITIVLITHDRGVAEHARRIIHLLDGRIEREEDLPAGPGSRGRAGLEGALAG